MSKFFDNLQQNKLDGIFISGDINNGELKQWWNNGQLWIHCFYKDGNLHGEYKQWHSNGDLWIHKLFKKGIMIKVFLNE